MIRFLLWAFGGLLLGGLIHLIVTLTLPRFAENDVWAKMAVLDASDGRDGIMILPAVQAGEPNTLGLDPEFAYAVCRLDLSRGPGVVSGLLPDTFWSLGVFARNGTVAYSTTNRDGIGRTLDLGVFNPTQTRLLAEQRFDTPEGLLIVESPTDEVLVVVRLLPTHPVVRDRYAEALHEIACSNIALPT